MEISIVIPSRNNLKYLKFAYASIRENIKEQHEIILLDDASTDGTFEWMEYIKKIDKNVQIYRNASETRVGHCVLYDIGAGMAKNDIFCIFHADMVASPNCIQHALSYLDRRVVVSMTRCEPPLHPKDPAKEVEYFGTEPEDFYKEQFLNWVAAKEIDDVGRTTEGVFAPWMMYVEDFKSIGGHDKKLFAPMELEDSDIFNRFKLNNYKFIQCRSGFVYHFTCRGSRFKDGVVVERVIDLPDGSKWYKPVDSEEYTKLRQMKFREWWRKWHTDVLHDEYLNPITRPRYDIGFDITNCNAHLLGLLEPWCDSIHLTTSNVRKNYIESEQPNTKFDLFEKITENSLGILSCDVVVSFDATKFIRQDQYDFIRNLSQILTDSGEVGEFEYDIFKIRITKLIDYRKKMIVNEDFYNWKRI